MNNSFISYPNTYDSEFIRTTAHLNAWSYETVGDETVLRFMPADFDKVAEVVENYPSLYLEIALPKKLEEASRMRDLKIGSFEYGGMTIPLDAETRANITGAVVGLKECEDVESIEWSLGGGVFVTLPRAVVLALGVGAFRYVQRCFAAHRVIAEQIRDADTIADLDFDLAAHEAWNA